MQEKRSRENEDLWFTCPKCGTDYDEYCEEIIPPEEIKGSIEWAYSPTSDEDRWDALKKARLREQHEAINREDLGSCITGEWKGKK